MSTIESVLDENEYDDVVWAGDINAEFSLNTHYTNVIQSFVEEVSLLECWDKWPIDFSHHGELSGHSYTSILDHFFLSENISKYIKDADVLHLPSNTSDHCPIYCSINTKMLPSKCRTPMQQKPKANYNNNNNNFRVWDKASDEKKSELYCHSEEQLKDDKYPSEYATLPRCTLSQCKSSL